MEADDKKRVELLAAYILEESPNLPGVERLHSMSEGKVNEEDVKWLRSFCGVVKKPDGPYRKHVLYLLAVLGRASGSPIIDKAVRDAFDELYAEIVSELETAQGIAMWPAMSLWGNLVAAIGKFGDSSLLTPGFWEAVEAEEFKYFSQMLRRHASSELLEKLQSYRGTPFFENEHRRRRLEEFIKEVTVVLQYPEVKEVPQRFYRSLLRDLRGTSPKQGKKVLERHRTMIRKTLEKEKKEASDAAASGPSGKLEPSE